MKNSKRIFFFLGTTAELIKVAPVIAELKKRKIDFEIIASNQNTLNFEELRPLIGKCSASYTLKAKSFKWPKNIYLRFVVWLAKTLGNYFLYFGARFKGEERRSIYFIVHGDTISALMGAIVAKFYGVKLMHIESGLKSFSFFEPFPEEFCRFVVSNLADVHFCPNSWAMKNLKDVRGIKINTFDNTVGESLHRALKVKSSSGVKITKGAKYFILVLHRQEHTLFNKGNTKEIIDQMTQKTSDNLKCVFIMHSLTKDYLIKEKLYSKLKRKSNIVLPERLSYTSFIKLLSKAEFIATDGGSNQEEAYFLGKPCLILRKKTERIEGLDGNAILTRGSERVIKSFLESYKKYKKRRVRPEVSPSKIIVDFLSNKNEKHRNS